MGAFNRIEFGYTRNLHQEDGTAGLSKLWSSGFNVFHGKLNLLSERRTWRGLTSPRLGGGVPEVDHRPGCRPGCQQYPARSEPPGTASIRTWYLVRVLMLGGTTRRTWG